MTSGGISSQKCHWTEILAASCLGGRCAKQHVRTECYLGAIHFGEKAIPFIQRGLTVT